MELHKYRGVWFKNPLDEITMTELSISFNDLNNGPGGLEGPNFPSEC